MWEIKLWERIKSHKTRKAESETAEDRVLGGHQHWRGRFNDPARRLRKTRGESDEMDGMMM